MVGDNWEHDIAPAASLGIPGYWIAGPGETPPTDDVSLVGLGTLADLWEWAKSKGLAL